MGGKAVVVDTPMMRQYRQIKARHPQDILFFRLGDFYEMFLDDAVLASNLLEITLTGRGKDDNRVPMCGIPYHAADTYIQRLVKAGYRVAICEQVESADSAQGITKRDVVKIVTPATFLSENALDPSQTQWLAAVSGPDQKGRFGLAYADLSTGSFYVQLCDSETLLKAALSRLEVSECLFPENTRLDSSFLDCPSHYFYPLHEQEAVSQLAHFFKVHDLNAFGIDLPNFVMIAAWGVLQSLKETQKVALSQFRKISQVSPEGVLLIDALTRDHLELLATQKGAVKGSLFGLLNRCKTAMGARQLKALIKAPFTQKKEIEDRLDAVDVLVKDVLSREEIREVFLQVYDLERLLSRIVMKQNNPKDVQALKQSLGGLKELPDILQHLDSDLLRRLTCSLEEALQEDGFVLELYELIDKALHETVPSVIRDGGIFKPGYSEVLDNLVASFESVKSWVNNLEGRERQETGIKALKVGFNKVFGYYIEISNSYKGPIPESYVRKQTLSNAERYITPILKEKEILLLNGEDKQKVLEVELYEIFVESLLPFVPKVQAIAKIIADIDCLQALASVSHYHNYQKPLMHENPALLRLALARHPLLESVEDHVIPNSISFDDQKSQFLLITGPNMAGKSTVMKQVALTVIMAQMGCFVPAEKADIGIVDKVFTRIGAMDNLGKRQSTFMVEMIETAAILNHATPKSLILLDEIGRGTSTYDGISIAAAITEDIHNRIGARTLFATHYHELTVLEEKLSRLKNLSMKISEIEGRLVFQYKLQAGSADKSYGIHVAEMAGLPKALIQRATRLLNQLEQQTHKSRHHHGVIEQLRLF